ncbi:MAG: sodium:calcium antiporter [Anaerolineae bacterium]
MIWLQFVLSAGALALAAIKLADYGDAIAVRTRLGGMFVGTLLIAGATSLPELLSNVNALYLGEPNLAAGNTLGSNMVNMLLLGILSLVYWRVRVLRLVVLRHAMTAALALLLGVLAVFFILAKLPYRIGWVGLDSLALIAVYVLGVWLLRTDVSPEIAPPIEEEELVEGPTLRHALIGFAAATAVLVISTPYLVRSSVAIADTTGLGTGFVGTALLALVTSLPELVSLFAAARLGAYDMAVGNLFGSNVFNVFGLGLSDLLYTRGQFIQEIDPSLAMVGLLGLVLTGMGLVSNLFRSERRHLAFDVDALLIVVLYALGMFFLYDRGLAG